MKRILSLLFLAVGCTIIPDDAYKDLPEIALAKVEMVADDGASPGLIGKVDHQPEKMTIVFEGELDPFLFSSKVTKIEYSFNDDRKVSSIVIIFEDGSEQTEEITYNSKGGLNTVNISREGLLYKYEFSYQEGNLDYVTIVVSDGRSGFIKRGVRPFSYEATSPEDYITLYSIFPFTPGLGGDLQMGNYCNEQIQNRTTNVENTAYFLFFRKTPYNYQENLIYEWQSEGSVPVVRGGQNAITSPYSVLSAPGKITYDITDCVGRDYLSHYRLIPDWHINYLILEILNYREERALIKAEPERISAYYKLHVTFEYNILK